MESFIYDEKVEYDLPEFFAKFKDKLPQLVVVTGGDYGMTKWDDLANDTVGNMLYGVIFWNSSPSLRTSFPNWLWSRVETMVWPNGTTSQKKHDTMGNMLYGAIWFSGILRQVQGQASPTGCGHGWGLRYDQMGRPRKRHGG